MNGALGFFSKIRTRFVFSFAAVVLFLTVIIVTMLVRDYYAIITSSAEVSMSRLSESIFQTLFVSMNYGGSIQVHEALAEAKTKQLVDRLDLHIAEEVVSLFRPSDRYTAPADEEIQDVFSSAIERFRPVASESGRGIRYIKPFDAKAECVVCHTNVEIGTVLGVMDLTLSLEQFDIIARSSIYRVVLFILLLVGTSGIILNSISTRLIFTPIQELMSATRKLAKNAGEPNVRLVDRGANEFGYVARNFNIFINKVYDINSRLAIEEQKTKAILEGLEEEVTRRTKETQELNRELMRYMAIVDEHVITSRTDKRGIITDVSSAFCHITERTKLELIGQPHNIVRHPDMPREIFSDMWETIKAGSTWRGEIKNRTKSGGFYWVRTVISPVFDESHSITGFVAVRYDISLQKELEKTLQKLTEATKRSHTDALTGMMNRLRINELLQMEIDRIVRYGGELCVALMDIDHFKLVNDTYGHLVGDRVLITLAKILMQRARKTDLAGRWGGEEFLIVLTNTAIEGAIKKLDTVRKQIETETFTGVPQVTASFGVASYQAGDTLESLVGRADVALYFAKESGRNRVEASPTQAQKFIEVDLEKGE
ncbi:hypothetical protein AGMMS50229_12760 [Campylobacterota bacterium]|nr:hypothetical protein AGMMS50229_12760 [Campylobacterota bacterium]